LGPDRHQEPFETQDFRNMHALRVIFVLALAMLPAHWFSLQGQAAADPRPALSIDADQIRRHLEFLASDDLAGRDSGEPGLEVAADYIAHRFKEYGLEPAGDSGTYFQHFTVPKGAEFGSVAGAVVKDPKGAEITWRPGSEVVPFGFGEQGAVQAPLVFAGYGITTSPQEEAAGLKYDDYAGLDVKGKAVVILRFAPRSGKAGDPFGGKKSPHASLPEKLKNARQHGASAVVFVSPPEDGVAGAWEEDWGRDPDRDIRGIALRAAPRQPTLPAVVANTAAVELLLRSAGADLESLVARIDEALSPRSFALSGWTLRIHTVRGHMLLRNVAGRIRGKEGSSSGKSIVIGAHYDHIGQFGGQISARNLGKVHNGADDNASGTAGVLELARVFAARGPAPERSLLFLCFSAEELGLVGSLAWLNAPRRFETQRAVPVLEGPAEPGIWNERMFPLREVLEATGNFEGNLVEVKDLASGERGWVNPALLAQVSGPDPIHALSAMVNLDMIGRAGEKASVEVVGSDSSPIFGPLLDKLSASVGLPVHKGNDMMGGSDHMSFRGRKIPVLFFFSGIHPQYHGPDDDVALINFEGERRILELVRACVENLEGLPDPFEFSGGSLAGGGRGRGKPRLGVEVTTFQREEGALVKRTTPESPASAAGIREGDVIIALGSSTVRRAEDLTAAVEEAPRGESIAVKVRRGGTEEVLHVTFPSSRGAVGVRFGSMPDFTFAERGVRFQDVRAETPAAKAGVKAGDVLVRWNGKDVENLEQWTGLLSSHKSGDEVTIQVRRGDSNLELKVKLEARD
jgi:hypothetical protein